ncbi:MAG: hypothetical protein OXF02_05970 [Simkaniaceae bacterium]|nr:hypothetical protein [Simkaniaceae bacterium]
MSSFFKMGVSRSGEVASAFPKKHSGVSKREKGGPVTRKRADRFICYSQGWKTGWMVHAEEWRSRGTTGVPGNEPIGKIIMVRNEFAVRMKKRVHAPALRGVRFRIVCRPDVEV